MEKTSIQVSSSTLGRLKTIKRHSRESYDELLNYLIDEIDKDELTEEEIEEIKAALENVKKGYVKPIEKVAEEMGILLE